MFVIKITRISGLFSTNLQNCIINESTYTFFCKFCELFFKLIVEIFTKYGILLSVLDGDIKKSNTDFEK